MILSKQRLHDWYRLALRLYPHAYREEYAEEMQTVFEMRLAEFSAAPGWNLFTFSLRELRDLPFGLLAAYQSERNRLRMKNSLARWFIQEPGSGWEILLAVMPFFLTVFVVGLLSLIPSVDQGPMWAGQLILSALAFVQVVLGIIGLTVRLPRWSLPYAGVLTAVAPLSILSYIYNLGILRLFEREKVFSSTVVFFAGYLVVLFLLLVVIAWVAGKIEFFRSFADRMNQDKTLLPFMMYGGSMVFLVVNYEDIKGAGWYLILSALAMMLGVWFYLRRKTFSAKMAALSLGSTAAIFVALLANIDLVEYYSPTLFSLGSIQIQTYVIYVLFSWVLSQVIIFMPLLLGGKSNHSTEEPQPAAV